MFGKALFPQSANNKERNQNQKGSIERSTAPVANEGNTRMTPNEAFWKSRSTVHATTTEEETVRGRD